MLVAFILGYLVVTLVIGLWAARLVKTSGDFIVAGRRLPAALNAAAIFALWYGSETVFGASSEFLQHGLLGVIEDPFGGALCFILMAVFFARKLYRLNIITISDIFRNTYGKKTELLSAVMMVISFFGYVAAQMVALGLIFNAVTGISVTAGMLIGAVLVTVYTFFGGMWAVSITDFLQSAVIVIGLLCLAVFWGIEAGGIGTVLSRAPEGHFRFFPEPKALDITEWLVAWAVLGLGSIASQDLFQRVNSARSERAAISSLYIGAGLYLFFALMPLFIVLAAQTQYPEIAEGDTQTALPQLVLDHAPLWLQVVFFGSLLSAVMSTCSGALLAPATILSENIIRPLSRTAMSDHRLLWATRLSVLGIAVVSALMASWRGNIYELVGESSVFGLVSLLVPMTAALYWKKATPQGAVASMLAGSGVWFIFAYLSPLPIPALVPGTAASVAGLVIGSLWTRGGKHSGPAHARKSVKAFHKNSNPQTRADLYR